VRSDSGQLPGTPEATKMSPGDKWRQAAGDIGAARCVCACVRACVCVCVCQASAYLALMHIATLCAGNIGAARCVWQNSA